MNRKKHNKKKHSRTFQPRQKREQEKNISMVEQEIIKTLYKAPSPQTPSSIFSSKSKFSYKERQEGLKNLIRQNVVQEAGKKKYTLKKKNLFLQGTLDANPQGFGFIHNIENRPQSEIPTQDPYVAKHNRNGAQHGDYVLIHITHVAKNGRCEAIILAVLKRRSSCIAGILSIDPHSGKGLVFPEDRRYSFVIEVIPTKESTHGTAVLVDLEENTGSLQQRRGKIREVLGDPDSVAVQIRFVTEQLSLPQHFSNEAIAELANIDLYTTQHNNREDLRKIKHVTIDGKTAKDFDDAIAVEKRAQGFRLYVSIADVSQYVRVGSALDRDAYERGTSVYFPGAVIPMLPEKISNDLCSLVPYQDRLTLTAILDFTESGRLKTKRFCRSTITSKHRFTYTDVQSILDDNNVANDEERMFLPMLKDAKELATILRARRRKRGAIGFNMPEATILLNDKGEIAEITRLSSIFSRHIVEEFMLSANEAVAEFFTEKGSNMLYRIHEKPDEEKVEEFRRYAKSLGIELPQEATSSGWFAHIVEESKGSDREFVINTLLLRSMKQAKYSPDNVGHFGLAATDYTHFTSPIRRYPDLMVHRELCRLIGCSDELTKNRSAEGSGDFLSGRERMAIKAERETSKRLQCIYMEQHIGETFDAVISGVSDTGFYVELIDFPIHGTAPVDELVNDIYLFDQRGHNLIAQNTGSFYRLGAKQKVRIKRIDRAKNRIIVQPILTRKNRA